jgi:hypothetical protein
MAHNRPHHAVRSQLARETEISFDEAFPEDTFVFTPPGERWRFVRARGRMLRIASLTGALPRPCRGSRDVSAAPSAERHPSGSSEDRRSAPCKDSTVAPKTEFDATRQTRTPRTNRRAAR